MAIGGLPAVIVAVALAGRAAPVTPAAPVRRDLSLPVTVASRTACPSADEVNQALAPLLPPSATPTAATINITESGARELLVEFRWSAQGGAEVRRLSVGDLGCSERAQKVGVVIAAWVMGPAAQHLPPPALLPIVALAPAPTATGLPAAREPVRPLSPPTMAAASASPALASSPASGWQSELAAGVLLGVEQTTSNAARIEVARLPAGSGFGWVLGLTAATPATRALGSGEVHWTTVALSAGLRARKSWSWLSLEADMGPTGAAVVGWGEGYDSDTVDAAAQWGGTAALRVVGHGRPFHIWIEARGTGWLDPPLLRVDSAAGLGPAVPPPQRVPSSALHVGLGIAFPWSAAGG